LILDSTYLLPLAGIAIDTNLLGAILNGKANMKLEDISISLIFVLELQAKIAKLKVPVSTVIKAIEFIMRAFNVVSFYKPEVVRVSHELGEYIPDYIDCVIIATAIVLKEDLVTEDTITHKRKKIVEGRYKVSVLRYRDLIKT